MCLKNYNNWIVENVDTIIPLIKTTLKLCPGKGCDSGREDGERLKCSHWNRAWGICTLTVSREGSKGQERHQTPTLHSGTLFSSLSQNGEVLPAHVMNAHPVVFPELTDLRQWPCLRALSKHSCRWSRAPLEDTGTVTKNDFLIGMK